MGAYGALVMLLLAGFSALYPGTVAWVYIVAFMGFEFWLARKIVRAGRAAVEVNAPPYLFSDEEAALVGRYRFYFTFPGVSRECGSVLAALGLSALILAPWLTLKQAFVQAILVGMNIFAVGRLTKQVAPLMALRIAASKGDRQALRMLELHDPLWQKIRAANEPSVIET